MINQNKIEQIIKRILENNNEAVTQYKSGKDKMLDYLVGQVMKESKGKVNPETAKLLMQNIIDNL